MSAAAYVHPRVPRPPRSELAVVQRCSAATRSLDAGTYRAVFRGHPGGVAVITADAGSGPVGFTATSVVSVSLEPPMVSFAISSSASSFPSLMATDRVVVHFLDAGQAELARRFATSGIDRFAQPTRWSRDADGSPVLDDPPCHLVGRLEQRFPVGDHHLLVARLERADQRRPYRPLVYSEGRYGTTVAGRMSTGSQIGTND